MNEGHIMEFGVSKGGSTRLLASLMPERILHAFDSFEGLPEDWVTNPIASFSTKGKIPKLPKNVNVVKGYFSETLPNWLDKNLGKVAFIHVDCDLRSSTAEIFERLGSRIDSGTVIVFDDYFNFPSWKEDGHAVFKTFLESRDVRCDYIGYAFKELAVRIR